MSTGIKVAITIPGYEATNRYFSLRLKEELRIERSEYKASNKILILSDIGNNYKSFYKLLMAAGAVDKKLNWTFGDGHLVIFGDCLSRSDQAIECLWLIYGLENKAIKKGGWVHFVLGNHQILNMHENWQCMEPNYATTIKKDKGQYAALYDGNGELGRWLKTKNIIERIGGNLFVHGGVSQEINQLNLTINEINYYARMFYANKDKISPDSKMKILFDNNISPIWYSGYYTGHTDMSQINATLSRFGVQTIITGHSVVPGIQSFYDGKVINVNADHNKHILQALLIQKRKYYTIETDGISTRLGSSW